MQNDAGNKTQKAFIPVDFVDVAISHYSQETARKKIETNCSIANRILQQIEVYSFEVAALSSHRRMKLRCLKFLKEMG